MSRASTSRVLFECLRPSIQVLFARYHLSVECDFHFEQLCYVDQVLTNKSQASATLPVSSTVPDWTDCCCQDSGKEDASHFGYIDNKAAKNFMWIHTKEHRVKQEVDSN